jgi:hypothetical protein
MPSSEPFSFEPMLCESAERLPEGGSWLQRSKNDQFRVLKVIHPPGLVNSIYPAVSGGSGHSLLVVLGGERPSASALRL